MNCIIREKKTRGKWIDPIMKRLAIIESRPIPRQTMSYRYVNVLNGEEYLCVAGGLAWPGTRKGFAIVVGVTEVDDGIIHYNILEEAEQESILPLLRDAYNLYLKYGQGANGKGFTVMPWQWYGDPESGYNEALRKFNEWLEKHDKPRMPPINYPAHHKDTKKLVVYAQTIHDVAMPPGRLSTGDSHKILNYIKMFEGVDKGTVRERDWPAIAALGYVLTWMHEYEPWIAHEGEEEFATLTTFEDYAHRSNEDSERELYQTLDALERSEGEEVDEIMETVL